MVGLDATPQGKKLYEQLGFVEAANLWRMERTKNPSISSHTLSGCKNIEQDDLPEIIAYDERFFGLNRSIVLNNLYQRNPEYSFVIYDNEKIKGYCMGRAGSNFEHIGPIAADSDETSQLLLLHALSKTSNKPVIVDVFDQQQEFLVFLSQLGFRKQRPLTRMFLGERGLSRSSSYFAIAGPELG